MGGSLSASTSTSSSSYDDLGGLREEELEELSSLTLFTRAELQSLYHRFRTLDRASAGHLLDDDLLRVPEVAMNPLVDRVVQAVGGGGGGLTFVGFCKALAAFNARRSKEEVLEAVFECFDRDRDGLLDRREIAELVRTIVGDKGMQKEDVDKLVELTIAEADWDGDGALNFVEYCRALDGVEHVDVSIRQVQSSKKRSA